MGPQQVVQQKLYDLYKENKLKKNHRKKLFIQSKYLSPALYIKSISFYLRKEKNSDKIQFISFLLFDPNF